MFILDQPEIASQRGFTIDGNICALIAAPFPQVSSRLAVPDAPSCSWLKLGRLPVRNNLGKAGTYHAGLPPEIVAAHAAVLLKSTVLCLHPPDSLQKIRSHVPTPTRPPVAATTKTTLYFPSAYRITDSVRTIAIASPLYM